MICGARTGRDDRGKMGLPPRDAGECRPAWPHIRGSVPSRSGPTSTADCVQPSAEPVTRAIILQVLRLACAHAGRDQDDIRSDPRSARSRGAALGCEGSGPQAGPGARISGRRDGSDRQVASGIEEH